jgi:very-short-patch-repair endonuclease
LGALLEARPASQRPMSFEFEGKLFRALTAARLPKPVSQFRVVLPNGGERFLDFAYPEVRLAIEADSSIWHASREAWEKDRERNNDLVALGWSFLLLTWDTVRYLPAEAASKVRDSLGARRVGERSYEAVSPTSSATSASPSIPRPSSSSTARPMLASHS